MERAANVGRFECRTSANARDKRRPYWAAAQVVDAHGRPHSAVEAAGGRPALQQLANSSADKLQEAVADTLRLLAEHVPAAPPPDLPDIPGPRVCAAEGCSTTTGLCRCGGCGHVRYCGAACRGAHWRAHRSECKHWQAEAQAACAAAAAAQGEAAVQPRPMLDDDAVLSHLVAHVPPR